MYLLTKLINQHKVLVHEKMSMLLANFSYNLSVLLLSMRCTTFIFKLQWDKLLCMTFI
jgi:hypothetical protein